MSVDHDRQTRGNYCQMCSEPCEGVDVITIDEDFLTQGVISDETACVAIEESVLRVYHHAGGDGA